MHVNDPRFFHIFGQKLTQKSHFFNRKKVFRCILESPTTFSQTKNCPKNSFMPKIKIFCFLTIFFIHTRVYHLRNRPRATFFLLRNTSQVIPQQNHQRPPHMTATEKFQGGSCEGGLMRFFLSYLTKICFLVLNKIKAAHQIISNLNSFLIVCCF